MAANTTLGALIEKAWEVGALLNSIPDDDARELAQEKFEQVLCDELWKGSQLRELTARVERGNALLAAEIGLRLVEA